MRFTLCGYHHNEGHFGDWQTCSDCRTSFETEMYVWYGTNEYNFERLSNPPEYEPALCARCRTRISLAHDAHTRMPNGERLCGSCPTLGGGLR